jgi:hypothetical protein
VRLIRSIFARWKATLAMQAVGPAHLSIEIRSLDTTNRIMPLASNLRSKALSF